jgi:hypothetical protein
MTTRKRSIVIPLRTPLAAALAVAALACGLAACSDDSDTHPAQAAASSSSAAASDQPPIPLPTPTDLNAGILIALDPATPPAQKASAIQGSGSDPELADRMTQAARSSGVSMTILDVKYIGHGVMNAGAKLVVNGKPVEGETTIPFVAENGRWKLQKAWACQMVANAGLSSPACS